MKISVRRLVGIIFLVAAAISLWFVLRDTEPEPVVIVPREEKTVRFLEGWTNRDAAEYLSDNGLWAVNDFLSLSGSEQGTDPFDISSWRVDFPWLPEDAASLEGYLFPDTYRIFASSTPEELIEKMLDNFDRKLTSEMRDDIAKQGKTLEEIIIMASLIEKEAPVGNVSGNDEDARLISGVFWNRLAIGQALQSDATLSFIFDDTKPQHNGAELEVDSPYNTYKYAGLPPGPIGNPGLLAIRAAIYPAETDFYFFLTPTDSREVIYARTYAEHLQNKHKYLD